MPQLIRPLALPIFLLLVCFALAGFALSQTPQTYDKTIVRFKSRDCPSKDNFAGTSVSIGGAKAVSDAKGGDVLVDLGPADYMVSNLVEPGHPNAKLVAVRVLLGSTLIKEYPANESGMANIALEERIFGQSGARQVIDIITANDCDTGTGPTVESTPEDRKVDVILKSVECDKQDFRGYTAHFNGQPVVTDSGDIVSNVSLTNGRYRVRISAPGFPNAKLSSLSVYRPNKEVYVRRDANSVGEVDDLTLEGDLWEGASATARPVIFLYTVGDCASTSYEPPAQRLGGPPQIRIASVTGHVTVFNESRPDGESEAVKGSFVEDMQVVYTRPGARVELVASDKRLFILGGKTVVKFVIRKDAGGTWSITADIKTSEQFTVRHVGYVKGEDGYVWKVITPTASVKEEGTIYNVIYDESSKVTTVGVEQGSVTVTPVNASLKPFTLNEGRKADVSADRVSPVTPYSPADDRLSDGGGSYNVILIVGVGAAAVFVLILLPIGGYVVYRVLWRTPPKPAYTPTAGKAGAPPQLKAPVRDARVRARNDASARARHDASRGRCPNPNCRRAGRTGRKFCATCGTRMR